ncbi:hypothetical protein NPIL_626421 [Nephila pilipes]|uniref:Uncharacterized protein n=1 Tax=Nephila pilipes TaxID=299642 RepID=A0A8X6P780_NEPPI|nr:hypothetical protein NPIL_626421 [Nephila pilipes]
MSTCGRYFVSLPLKQNIQKYTINLGESGTIASKRLDHLWRRLNRDPKLKILYSQLIEEYLALGHLEVLILTEVHLMMDSFSRIMVYLDPEITLVL